MGWAELETSLGEVDELNALPAPYTRLDASTTGPSEGRALLEIRRRRSAMTKCSPSIIFEGNGQGMIREGARGQVMAHGRYINWSKENLIVTLLLGNLG